MNKEFYIQTQIQSAFINKILLENDANNALRILASNFELLSISDAIDSYLSLPTNMLFLFYFDEVRNKLKEVLEMCTFKLNSCDDDYLADEVYATQIDLIEMINSLDYEKTKEDHKEAEETLLGARGIDANFNLNREQFLKICYSNDYNVFLFLNSMEGRIDYTKTPYAIVLMSLYYYFSQIVFSTDVKLTKSHLDMLLTYNCTDEEKEFFDYYRELIKRTYNESLKVDFDEFIEQNLEEDEETKKERLRNIKNCQIYDFETYKTKKIKKKQKGE